MKEEAETLRVDFTLSKKSCIKKKEKEEKNYSYNAVHIFTSKLVCKNIHVTCILLVQSFLF